jgi:hypothetical protein
MKAYVLRFCVAASLCALVFAGCNKSLSDKTAASNEIISAVVVPPTCGNSLTRNLEDYSGLVSGSVQISNDATNYYIKISETVADYKIETVKLIYGDENHVAERLRGLIQCGLQAPALPDMVVNYSPGQDEVLITIPIASIPGNCFFFHARVTVVKRDPNTGQVYYSYDLWTDGTVNASQNPCQEYYQYCKQTCPPQDCGQLRTQTPGGWGSEPNGNNAGTYLHANFDAAFPTDLKIGCNGGFTITMTNAQAITDLLPTGGQAAVLKASAVDPADVKNVLVGHLIALTLSVRFDVVDPNFGQAGIHLGDMVIGSGAFAGKTVSQFLTIANNVIGGCSNAYSISDINATASAINENYVDGNVNNGYLVCPGGN